MLRKNRKIRNRNGVNPRKIFYQRLARVFIVLLLVVFVFNTAKRDKDFSEEENRVLAEKPKLTWDSVLSGEYMKDFETYVSDQFFARNQWITLKLYEDRFLGKKESNGVYLGKDGYLFEVPDQPDWTSIEKNMNSISSFAENHADISTYMCLAPNSFYIKDNLLPLQAPVRNQAKDLEKIRAMEGSHVTDIDITKTLKNHSDEYIYYKTDHHWTSLGAKYAFGTVAEKMGLDSEEASYDVYTVSDDFQGTLASKSGYHGSEDEVQIYHPKDLDYVVSYVEEEEKSTSVYDSSCLKEKDKYTVFFGGNHSRIDIGTTKTEWKNLLIFKDSYANCFVQFLLPHYQNIIIVDPRYYYDNIESLIENCGITDILFLYNVNTFVTDHSIADILTNTETETSDSGAESSDSETETSEKSEEATQ